MTSYSPVKSSTRLDQRH